MPFLSPAMTNPPSTSTSQLPRSREAVWPSIDTRQVVETEERGLDSREGCKSGMGAALTALCAGA